MKNYITPPYVFIPGASGVGTIKTNIVNFDIKLLVGIINVTREAAIYWPSFSGRGFTNVSGDTITLEFDTSTYSAGDVLQIIYESTPQYPSVVDASTGELIEEIRALTEAMMSILKTIGMAQVNPLTGRMFVDGSGVTQPVSGTVSAAQSGVWNITNLATLGGQNANSVVQALERFAADNLALNIDITP